MKSLYVIAILAATCTCLTGYAQNQTSSHYDYEISVGERFKISLAANVTTGYTWAWPTGDQVSVVREVEYKYVGDPNPEGLTGVGGQSVWIFEGAKAGVDTIVLIYAQAWDPASVARTKKIIVKVNPGDDIMVDYEVSVGERFEVSLKANATTGYRWTWPTGDQVSIVREVEHKYVADPNPEELAGKGGQSVWVFEGASPGIDTIVLEYARRGSSTSIKSKRIIVKVKPDIEAPAEYEISIGERFEISLEANPTTGYEWTWPTGDQVSIVREVEHKYVADPNPEGLAGKGGQSVWVFEGASSGIDTIVLEYARSGSSTSIKSKRIIVKVDADITD